MASLYSKKRDLPVLSDKAPTSSTVATLGFGEKVEVVSTEGKWVKVKAKTGSSGWVYSGNLQSEAPPADNKNDFGPTGAGEAKAATAARGLDESASAYAGRHDFGNAKEEVLWMEGVNDKVSAAQITEYLQTHKLGEYGA